MRKIVLTTLLLVCGALATACVAQSSNNAAPNPAASTSTASSQTAVPPAAANQNVAPTEISAELGPCAVLFTVNGKDAKPVYNAKIATRVRYGVGSLKRLDLEAYTNSNGQAKFTHLPSAPKKPIYFYISKDDGLEIVEFAPDVRCRDEKTVVMK